MDYPDEIPRRFFSDRANDQTVSELLGVCKGIVADGAINDAEAIALRTWLDSHPFVRDAFPANVLAERLELVFRDGIIEEDERQELQDMVRDLVGERADGTGTMNNSTRLPLNDPEPAVFFDGMEFVFTGHFCMPRRACEKMVADRAGRMSKYLRNQTDYLVVGTVASEAWVSAAWGTKILDAMDMRASGQKIAIISEAHWLEALEFGA